MTTNQLETTATQLVSPGKGILAADESLPTIKKRFDTIGVESTQENRRSYREILFTTPDFEQHVSGIILFDETLRQKSSAGVAFPELLAAKGVLPGIKVDKGTRPLPGFPDEKWTQGLDGLAERLDEYRRLGARFTKWRAVIKIGHNIPTQTGIKTNAVDLARFAALSQQAGLVPIVEPEVLMDGDHDIRRCQRVSAMTLEKVFAALSAHRVDLKGMLLKPSMVLSGKENANPAGVETVAKATLDCFNRVIPPALPGIVFLSGGQSSEQATIHLNAMNAMGPHPWELSFSFGRALQEYVLKTWKGSPDNQTTAQKAFYQRAMLNGLARYGHYTGKMETTST